MYNTNQYRRDLSTIKIIQRNVLKWTFNRRNELSNMYIKEDPKVLLLSSTGMKGDQVMKIFNYNIYQRNIASEDSAAIAIAVKRNMQHQISDDFEDDLLVVKLETKKGPVIMATAYRPPSWQNTPVKDLLRLFKRGDPVYLIAGLNVAHSFIGHSSNNDTGKIINNMIRKNVINYMGPDFNTRVGVNGISKPNIILKNRQGFFNYSIREREITTSDHLQMIRKLSTTALVKESPPRRLYSKTNWVRVKVHKSGHGKFKWDKRLNNKFKRDR